MNFSIDESIFSVPNTNTNTNTTIFHDFAYKYQIFISRLQAECSHTTFLKVLTGNNEEMWMILKNNSIKHDEKRCPKRISDPNCINKFPEYDISNDNHFKVTDTSYKNNRQRDWILDAIKATYYDYNPAIPYDDGDITMMVWYRYRQARRYVLEEDNRQKKEKADRIAAEYKEMKRVAILKKLEKEEQQYLDLATIYSQKYAINGFTPIHRVSTESDQIWGMRVFNYRMRIDQQLKNTKVKTNPNEAALNRLNKWLEDNPNFDDYGDDLAKNKIAFNNDDRFLNVVTNVSNSKRYKVPHEYMTNLLLTFAKYGWTQSNYTESNSYKFLPEHLNVGVTVEWPRVNSNGFPIYSEIGYVTSKYRWTKLQGNDRTATPITMHIRGAFIEDIQNRLVFITNKERHVRKMFPKEHQDYEYMNNAKLCTLYECRKFPMGTKITNIKVESPYSYRTGNKAIIIEFQGSTMSKSAIDEWKTEVEYSDSSNFARYYYNLNNPNKQRQTMVSDTLAQVRAAKATRSEAARQKGLNKKFIKEKTEQKSNIPTTVKIEKLIDLMKLRDAMCINEEEYTNLKKDLI
tara:strand:- start:341 stop:2059 length:1719 start_codon:yes stop_codon:yes gene_type:complete